MTFPTSPGLPALVHSYGCKDPLPRNVVMEQVIGGHRYFNDWIEIEIDRREGSDVILREHDPRIAELDKLRAEQDLVVETLCKEIKKRNAKERSRTATAEDKKKLKEERLKSRELKKEWAIAIKKAVLETKDLMKSLSGESSVKQKLARKETVAYWGTYLLIEASVKQAVMAKRPRFKRWDGEGLIGVQLQGGLDPEDVLDDTRFRLVPTENPRWYTAHLRVGSEKGTRNPIWVDVPVRMHRPLPAGSKIKWVRLLRRRYGTDVQWKLDITLTNPDGWVKPDRSPTGYVGVDLGWRLKEDGLRVAYWYGDDGKSGELYMPLAWLDRWKRAEAIESRRDLDFNTIRDYFKEWMANHEIPDWLVEATETLGKWRGKNKLAYLVIKWRDQRFDGDEGIHNRLENWRGVDKRLGDSAAHIRRKAAANRKDVYRCLAAKLRRMYQHVGLESINWSAFFKKQEAEDNENYGAMKKYIRQTSPFMLGQILGQSMITVKCAAEYTTQKCHKCGGLSGQADPSHQFHKCEKCGARWDQDLNAAINLMRLARKTVEEPEDKDKAA